MILLYHTLVIYYVIESQDVRLVDVSYSVLKTLHWLNLLHTIILIHSKLQFTDLYHHKVTFVNLQNYHHVKRNFCKIKSQPQTRQQ